MVDFSIDAWDNIEAEAHFKIEKKLVRNANTIS